jgi:ribosomal protein L25 (general stress protein Ctc)
LRSLEVVNDDGDTVTTEVARKQLYFMPLTPKLKHLDFSKKTTKHKKQRKESM